MLATKFTFSNKKACLISTCRKRRIIREVKKMKKQETLPNYESSFIKTLVFRQSEGAKSKIFFMLAAKCCGDE